MNLASISHLLDSGDKQISGLPISLSYFGQFYNAHFNLNLENLSMELVTPRPKRVYGMCNHMCTKGFLNYFSAIIEFLKIGLRVKL